MRFILIALAGCLALPAQDNEVTSTSAGTLNAVTALGVLIPAYSSTIVYRDVELRLWSRNETGYRVDAVSSFSATPVSGAAGGDTISAGDLGIGVVSVEPGKQAETPRADVIAPGFDYDPAATPVTNGVTPYAGAAAGQATVADLAVSRRILYGNKIGSNLNAYRYLQVTLRIGVLPQYFTPASFSGVITLTISNGP